MQDLRHSANLLWACVFCCYICSMLSSCLFKTHSPNDCILSSWSSFFCNLFVFRYQDPCLVGCGVSCNVPTLFDCLLIALGLRQKCFVLVMAIPALLFLGCLQFEFTRVYLHVLRTHIQHSRHLLRSVFVLYKQSMVSSPSSERKTQKCSCEEKIAPRRVVDAWRSNHHSLGPR